MNVPDTIELKIVSDGNKELSDVIVEMKVKAGRKNPYYIYFPKTDETGNTRITKDEFINQFKDYWELALMDYDGTPVTADPLVEISLFDASWLKENRNLALAWPLLKHETKKWASRQEQHDYMVNNRNSQFSFSPLLVNIHETQQIVLKVNEL